MTNKLSFPMLGWDDLWPTDGETNLANENVPVRFRILPRGSSWQVFRDHAFWGIFQTRGEANDLVRSAMIEIFSVGGAAQVRFT